MTGTISQFTALLQSHASDVRFFRSESSVLCPCLTPEDNRDPSWHAARPSEPVCDPSGHLLDPAATTDLIVKGFIQPVTGARGARLPAETVVNLFGGEIGVEIQADDQIGILPCAWGGVNLNFFEWGRSGEDFIEYAGRRFTVVNANLIPDVNGNPYHHWEVGLRLIAGDAETGVILHLVS